MTNLIADVVVREEESPLQTEVEECEGVSVEIQPSVASEETISPCVWIYGPPMSIEAVSSSFEVEPTVASHQCLNGDEENDQRLYRIEWTDRSVLGLV